MEADVLVFVPTISSKCPISSKPGPCGTLSATGYHRAMQGALKPSALMTRKLSEVQGMLLGSGLAWRRGPPVSRQSLVYFRLLGGFYILSVVPDMIQLIIVNLTFAVWRLQLKPSWRPRQLLQRPPPPI